MCNTQQVDNRFWTGLPAGARHDEVCAKGTNFIVIERRGGTLVVHQEKTSEHADTLLEGVDWSTWLRVRAYTAADAEIRYYDAQDQWCYWTNATKEHWEGRPVSDYLDVVLFPADDRPEVPPRNIPKYMRLVPPTVRKGNPMDVSERPGENIIARPGEVEIQLGGEESDVILVLPNGEKIVLQYRLDSPSIDVCVWTELIVTCWKGDDMEPADAMQGNTPAEIKHYAPGHVRRAKQLVIDLPSETVDEQKFTCATCEGRKRHFMQEQPDGTSLKEVFGCPTCDDTDPEPEPDEE